MVRSLYNNRQKGSSIVMIVALLWLTISLPFITSFQRESNFALPGHGITDEQNASQCEENSSSAGTEEKNPNSNSASEEYLHSLHETFAQLSAADGNDFGGTEDLFA